MTTARRLTALLLGLSLAGVLAGCVAQPVEECEPGVGEISEMGNVTPPGC